MKASKFGTALILLIPVGLVAGPVLTAGMRSEVAHWYLAAAANAVELKKGDADAALESARAWDPEVEKLQDYWSVRLQQLKTKSDLTLMEFLKEVPAERKAEIAEKLASQFASKGDFVLAGDVLEFLLGEKAKQNFYYWDSLVSQTLEDESGSKAIEVLRVAVAANPNDSDLRTRLAAKYQKILSSRNEFAETLEACKILFGEKYDRDTVTLNALAYVRALANAELDKALIDIDEALGYHPNSPELRDTRAWVYYQMGRNDDALLDADFSVKAFENPSVSSFFQGFIEWLEGAVGSPVTKPLEDAPTQSQDNMPTIGSVPVAEQLDAPETSGIEAQVVMLDPPKIYLTPSSTSQMTWSRGVIRYHRAKILEKLGRTDEADADWKWLEENRFPPDDRLH